MLTCPRCSRLLEPASIRCGDCGADVKLLARLHALPDLHFNQALAALSGGDPFTAQNLAGAFLAARPMDVEGWLLLGHAHARAGNVETARRCWQLVEMFRASDPRPARAAAALDLHLAAVAGAPSASESSCQSEH
jgi:hypothetical protein